MHWILLAGLTMLSVPFAVASAQGTGPGAVAGSAFTGAPADLPVSAAGANNNNNISAAPVPGPVPAPHPGEMVLRFGGRANVSGGAGFSSVDSLAGSRSPGR